MTSPTSQPAKDSNAKPNPFLWFHLVLMAIAPWLLVMTMAGLAVGDPLLPPWLEILILGLPAIALPAWWQCQQPFSPFSLWLAAKPRESLSDRDRRILSLLKQQSNGWYVTGWVAIVVAVVMSGIFCKLYGLVPLAQAIAPFPNGFRFFGIIYAEICLFLSNILMQSGISSLRLYLVTQPELNNLPPIAIEKIKNGFTTLSLLPAQMAEPLLNLFNTDEADADHQNPLEPSQPVIQESLSEALPVLEVAEPAEIIADPVVEFVDHGEASPEPMAIISEYNVSTVLSEPEALAEVVEPAAEIVNLGEEELEITELILNEDVFLTSDEDVDLSNPEDLFLGQELQADDPNFTDSSLEIDESILVVDNLDALDANDLGLSKEVLEVVNLETSTAIVDEENLQDNESSTESIHSELAEEHEIELIEVVELTQSAIATPDLSLTEEELEESHGSEHFDHDKAEIAESVDGAVEEIIENINQISEEAIAEIIVNTSESQEIANANPTEKLSVEASEENLEEALEENLESSEILEKEDLVLQESMNETTSSQGLDLSIANPSTIAPKSKSFAFNIPHKSRKQKLKTHGFGKTVRQEALTAPVDEPDRQDLQDSQDIAIHEISLTDEQISTPLAIEIAEQIEGNNESIENVDLQINQEMNLTESLLNEPLVSIQTINEDDSINQELINQEIEDEPDERAVLDHYVENILYDYFSESSDDLSEQDLSEESSLQSPDPTPQSNLDLGQATTSEPTLDQESNKYLVEEFLMDKFFAKLEKLNTSDRLDNLDKADEIDDTSDNTPANVEFEPSSPVPHSEVVDEFDALEALIGRDQTAQE